MQNRFIDPAQDFADGLEVMNTLNNRPRKCLGFKTPTQVFFDSDIPVALVS